MLRLGVVIGRREPTWYTLLKSALFLALAAMVQLFQTWMPLLRHVLWDPKRHIQKRLSDSAALTWSTSGVTAFDAMPPWRWPICLMDSGLLTCASHSADDSGFVAFARAGSAEHPVLKGMLWARWGSLAVINLHMIFDSFADDGAARRHQQAALATLVGVLLGVEAPPGSDVAAAVFDTDAGLRVPASSRCRRGGAHPRRLQPRSRRAVHRRPPRQAAQERRRRDWLLHPPVAPRQLRARRCHSRATHGRCGPACWSG